MITQKENQLYIPIEDNGKGIDITYAHKAIFSPYLPSPSKVGLKNVYEHLKAYYGKEVEITFSSIPFHRNIITFIVPYPSI